MELGATYLSNGTRSDRRLIKLLKDFLEWPLEDPFYDLLGVLQRMWLSLRMQGAETFA